MIQPKSFIEILRQYGIDFFAGVPDSLLKNVCAYIADNCDSEHNIITANEGGAIGLAAGHYLATGEIACVYMQNSGQGNVINPLASLTDRDVYSIPVLLLIGWRGTPGVHDEPQHVKQGKVTLPLLETMGIRYVVLSKDEAEMEQQLINAVHYMHDTNETYALVVEKDTFDEYKLTTAGENRNLNISREEAIQIVAASLDETTVVVSTTGMISRELFEYRANMNQGHERDFLTVGSMGHASQIALGIALAQPQRHVYCFDGDGAAIMHMGGFAIIGQKRPSNYVHVIFNNGAHDSVGGQPTVGLDINMPHIAQSVGYKHVFSVNNRDDLVSALKQISHLQGPVLLEIKVKKGNRKDLGRPTTSPIENKNALMQFLKQ